MKPELVYTSLSGGQAAWDTLILWKIQTAVETVGSAPKKRINWPKNCLSSLLWLTSLWLAHISHKDVGHHRQVGLPPMGSWQTQARITLVASKQNVILYHILVEVEVHCHPKKQVALYELWKTELISVISWINNRIITSDDIKATIDRLKMTHNDFKNPNLM